MVIKGTHSNSFEVEIGHTVQMDMGAGMFSAKVEYIGAHMVIVIVDDSYVFDMWRSNFEEAFLTVND